MGTSTLGLILDVARGAGDESGTELWTCPGSLAPQGLSSVLEAPYKAFPSMPGPRGPGKAFKAPGHGSLGGSLSGLGKQ